MNSIPPTTLPLSPPELPERLPGESVKWHARLLQYILAGSNRSLERIWREEREALAHNSGAGAQGSIGQRPSGAWHRASTTYQWEARASAFDAANFAYEAQVLTQERAHERRRRRALVNSFLSRAEQLLDDVALLRAAPASVSAAVARAVELHSKEWGKDPSLEDARDKQGMPIPLFGVGGTPGIIINIEGGKEDEDERVALAQDQQLRLTKS